MLTKVYLEGPMGKKFGREWELAVNSPNEALRVIDANKPGVFIWIKKNLDTYTHYRVICEYEDGRTEDLDNDGYVMERKVKSIRFVPVVEGAGAVFKMVVGIILIVVGIVFAQPNLIYMGASMLIGGIVEALSPRPKQGDNDTQQRKDATSYYFDGPANTTMQGVPVQLIYGRVLVGSHAISAALTIDQLMEGTGTTTTTTSRGLLSVVKDISAQQVQYG